MEWKQINTANLHEALHKACSPATAPIQGPETATLELTISKWFGRRLLASVVKMPGSFSF